MVCTYRQAMPETMGKVSTAVDPSAVCTEEACCICFESPLENPPGPNATTGSAGQSPPSLRMLCMHATAYVVPSR